MIHSAVLKKQDLQIVLAAARAGARILLDKDPEDTDAQMIRTAADNVAKAFDIGADCPREECQAEKRKLI